MLEQILRPVGRALSSLCATVLGTFDWSPPRWWQTLAARVLRGVAWVGAHRARAARIALAVAGLTALALGALWWWRTRPQPVFVAVTLHAPGPMNLTAENPRPAPLVLVFDESVAPLEAIGRPITEGIELSPKVEGVWRWSDDRALRFDPREEWPVGQRYLVTLDRRRLLRDGAALRERQLEFSSAPFSASVAKAEFYQDPTDPHMKKVVVTLRFSHPVEPRSLETRLRMQLEEPRAGGLFPTAARDQRFEVRYDEKRIEAYVHSMPLELVEQPRTVLVTVSEGVRAARGGRRAERIETRIAVPGRFSLAVQGAKLAFVTNPRLEGEQILTLELSEGVAPAELARRLQVWLLPARHPDLRRPVEAETPFDWSTPALVSDEILALSERLAIEPTTAGSDHPTLHGFRYEAEVGRYLYVRLEKGVKSFGGFELARRFDGTLRVPEPPQELRFMHNGAILALRGERKVSLYSRGVAAIRYEIARVLPDKLHLLASQSSGSFSSPEFAWNLGIDDLSEREERIVPARPMPAGRVQYHGFDLSPHLADGRTDRPGVFLLTAQAWDPVRKVASGPQDQRLLVVTDLGLLVKRGIDGSEDLFVQSVSEGTPVSGAEVQVLGRNGMALYTRTTDGDGHARWPSLRDFEREKHPVVYVVRRGGDASFLPADREDRGIDLSRFDIGGVSNAAESGELRAYVFSDRGIYRPGDEVRIGMIVKAASWQKPLAGLPLEAIVTDPRGATVRRERLRLSASAFEELTWSTRETSPTGLYNVSLHIVKDGAAQSRIGSTAVDVQEFLPDRMKLDVRLNRVTEQGWVAPEDLAGQVRLRTLFDTPAQNRRVTARLMLRPRPPTFAAWRDYRFFDPQHAKRYFDEQLPEATTDASGEARIPVDLSRFEAGTYYLQLLVQAYEAAGGRAVTEETAQLVSSMPYLVGAKGDGELRYVARGAERRLELIAIDPSLELTTPEGLTVSLLERRNVSVLARQNDGTLKYESRLKELPLSTEPLVFDAGRTQRRLATDAPGDFALVVRDAGGRELNRVEYSVAGEGNVAGRLDRNAELEVKLAKTDVVPGEEIELSIRAPYAGAGLIAIERETVHAFRWFRTESTSSVQRIRLPEGFEGNGYVTVTFVRDPNSEEIFASPLSYGIAPFAVDLARRRLAVELTAPERVKPGETLEVRYASARPSRILVFGVDEGILQVAGYRVPAPLEFFFEKRALEVETRQILDLILPEFQKLMRAAPGGDAEGDTARFLNPFRRKRDKPVVFWSGILDAGPEAKSFLYEVPDHFNGSMRIMAVGVGEETIGTAAHVTTVRGDFVILPNAPTAVAPGDEFELTAGVTNNLAEAPSADITTRLIASEHFEILGAASMPSTIASKREGTVRFRLRARERLGSGTLTLESRSGQRFARITSTLSVRPATPFVAHTRVGTFADGSIELPVGRGLFPEKRRLEATLSLHPMAIVGGLEAYLEEYPYGCTEQLVSRAMPAIVLAGRGELGREDGSESAHVRDRFASLLLELRARQHADGGFGFWPGDGQTAEYASVYALHFLVEAQARGQPAPRDVLERGQEWLARFAASEGASLADERARAYAIYVLTRMERVASAYANAQVERLDERHEDVWRRDVTATYLAGAYRLMQQDALARELIGGVRFLAASTAGETAAIEAEMSANLDGGIFQGLLAHNAQLLYFLAKHFPERIRARESQAILAVAQSASLGANTFASAHAVLALDAYAQVAGQPGGALLAIEELLANDRRRAIPLPQALVARVGFSAEAERLRLRVDGRLPAFYSITEAGFERIVPSQPLTQGMEIHRDLLDAKDRIVTSVRQGDEVRVRVRFRSLDGRSYWDGVVVDVLPGGFEPVLDGEGRWQTRWRPDYVDLREDRAVAFGSVTPQVQEFVYRVRATSSGTFTQPPAYVESMYRPGVQGRSVGARVTVEPR